MVSFSLLKFDDISLVLKAIQIRKNPDEVLRCCCSFLKVINFDHEAKAIKNYFRYSRIVFFRVPQEVNAISHDDKIAGEELKDMFYGKLPFNSLVQCGNLLMSFHENNHCIEYLTSALKFYLEAFNITVVKDAYAYYNYFSVKKAIKEILKFACEYHVCQSVFSDIFRVFYTTRYYISYCRMLGYSSNLEEVFEITKKCRIDVLDVWKNTEKEMRKSGFRSYCSLFENIDNFIPLIRHGKMEYVSIESYEYLWSTQIPYRLDLKITKDYGSVTFRSLQILHLLQSARSNNCSMTSSTRALKFLWCNITDAFLQKQDFYKSFNSMTSKQDSLLQEAWSWYADQVLGNDHTLKGPRSLSHLSRCSLRRQLTMSRQLPCGVEKLDIPKLMMKYILLEDCNLEIVEIE